MLQGDYKFFMEYANVSVMIEGPDGSASALGLVPSYIHAVSYFGACDYVLPLRAAS